MTRWSEFSDWDQLERDWTAWWDGTLARPLVTIHTRDPGTHPPPGDYFLTRFGLEKPASEILDYYEQQFDHEQYYGDAYPRWWVNFGAGVMAAFLGAGVEYRTPTTWFYHLEVAALREIELAYDPDNVWWQRVQAITRAAAERWAGRVVIGYSDIGGNLDILASLRGTQKLLYDLIDDPDTVEEKVQQITQLWLRYFGELEKLMPPEQRGRCCWAPLWSPQPGYMLQSDFCYMISPAMFERFVLPDLTTCCETFDYCFYHMDGKGQLPHLDRLLSIERLRGVQWQPGDGQPRAEGWLDVLRRIRESGKLCQVFVTLDGALTIARELGGQGFLFDIMDDGEAITPQQVENFYAELERLS
jgi:hypothetical protein